ncbi:hypothetical protein WJX84_002122 [Apatococcus fuscideae]|uniref:Peptide hydrolase n=1 Tax=Apatococcus fuscideae TaxID=2026836 RepID=A0AAW1SQD4_9CHLO
MTQRQTAVWEGWFIGGGRRLKSLSSEKGWYAGHPLQAGEADIRDPSVATEGIETASSYIENQLLDLQMGAARSDVDIKVSREQLTGGADMEFFNLPVANAFNNLTAVSIRIATPGSKDVKSVLMIINAHFDSVFGTTGLQRSCAIHRALITA